MADLAPLRSRPGPRGSAGPIFSKIVRLTLLAPEIADAILNGVQPAPLGLPILKQALPADWNEQRVLIAGAGCWLTG